MKKYGIFERGIEVNMKKLLVSVICLLFLCTTVMAEEEKNMSKLLYQGHGSLRIVTTEGKVIYVDPYAGDGYDLPADLILISHGHSDHTAIDLIKNRADECRIIQYTDALVNGTYSTYDLGYATVEAVQAGNNKNHDINVCVGWLITLSDGITIYATGDTSTTDQMAELAERNIDYAFFCCDGQYNMDIPEASACAALVRAKHSIPYHMAPGKLFDAKRAERFDGPGKLVIPAGAEIVLEK